MKTSNYLLFLSIYGGLTGALMLFRSTASLADYGVPADQYHIAIFQYLGIANLTTAALAFFLRNESQKVAAMVLLVYGLEMIASSIKGFIDVLLLGVPGNTFFWADAIVRFIVGFIALFFYFKNSKNQ